MHLEATSQALHLNYRYKYKNLDIHKTPKGDTYACKIRRDVDMSTGWAANSVQFWTFFQVIYCKPYRKKMIKIAPKV